MKGAMKRLRTALAVGVALMISGCSMGATTSGDFAHPDYDKDFSELASPAFQEGSYDYRYFFLPGQGTDFQEYVGDPMPYYEDGSYYIYYLKDGGDSFHHSIYLATTTDFTSFEEHEGPIIEASAGEQDDWVGTGSVVKVKDTYYFFYTGHVDNPGFEYQEKIMVAKGDSPTSFTKVADWELVPPAEIGQKRDFRDPQAYYDEDLDQIVMTVTAAQDGVARVVKFTLSPDLLDVTYDGIIVSDPTEAFYNLECSDTFKIGDTYYLTYSGQDDTLWYATSDSAYGPFDEPQRIDDVLFYAAKHVEDEDGNCYLVGWVRRSESPLSTDEVSAWGGNLAVQKVCQNDDGSLYLQPVDAVKETFKDRRELLINEDAIDLKGTSEKTYTEAFNAYERFMITGEFSYSGSGTFGLAFDMLGTEDSYKLVSVCPDDELLTLSFNGGDTLIANTIAELKPDTTYPFTYVQEGSCGVFYVDGVSSLTVRLYGVSGNPISLFTQGADVHFSNLREYTAPGK